MLLHSRYNIILDIVCFSKYVFCHHYCCRYHRSLYADSCRVKIEKMFVHQKCKLKYLPHSYITKTH